jgi:hypothetical protein
MSNGVVEREGTRARLTTEGKKRKRYEKSYVEKRRRYVGFGGKFCSRHGRVR